jgi:hypothetical protein
VEKKGKEIFTTKAILLALLEDMCKKTGKVSKDDFIDEAVEILSEEYKSEESVRNTVIQHYLPKLVESGDIKVKFENGKEMLYLMKKYPLTIGKVVPYRGLTFLTILAFTLFAFSLFWTIATKEWVISVVCGIMLFATLIALISYERCLIVKARKV